MIHNSNLYGWDRVQSTRFEKSNQTIKPNSACGSK